MLYAEAAPPLSICVWNCSCKRSSSACCSSARRLPLVRVCALPLEVDLSMMFSGSTTAMRSTLTRNPP